MCVWVSLGVTDGRKWAKEEKRKKWERREKKAQEQKRWEKNGSPVGEGWNCPKCQTVVYQWGRSTYSSYYSLPAVFLTPFPNTTPATIHQCFSVTVMHTHACARMCTHVHTRNAPSTSLSQRPRCPIRRQWRGDTVFARACQTDTTSPASKAPNTPIIFLPT